MTTPQPYSTHFAVPPHPGGASTVTENMLPPFPPRPRELTAGLYWMGIAGLVYLIGGVWQAIVLTTAWDSSQPPERLTMALSWLLNGVIACTVIAVVGWFIRRGSRVALHLAVAGAIVAMIRQLLMLGWLVFGLIRDHSPQALVDRFLDGPGSIGTSIASLIAVPALVAFTRRSSLRWSRKVEAIRSIRGLIRRGAPVHQVPPVVYE